jgi:hypothetical protein
MQLYLLFPHMPSQMLLQKRFSLCRHVDPQLFLGVYSFAADVLSWPEDKSICDYFSFGLQKQSVKCYPLQFLLSDWYLFDSSYIIRHQPLKQSNLFETYLAESGPLSISKLRLSSLVSLVLLNSCLLKLQKDALICLMSFILRLFPKQSL